MIIIDLDGERVNWKIKGVAHPSPSSLHIKARELLVSRFPTQQILEEVPIPIKRGWTLYLDFYLPLRKIAVEVNGPQHYKMSSLFHSSAGQFWTQIKNDGRKQEWCDCNAIKLIIFKFDEVDSWKDLI